MRNGSIVWDAPSGMYAIGTGWFNLEPDNVSVKAKVLLGKNIDLVDEKEARRKLLEFYLETTEKRFLCKRHRKYLGLRKPKTGCRECWTEYLILDPERRREEQDAD